MVIGFMRLPRLDMGAHYGDHLASSRLVWGCARRKGASADREAARLFCRGVQ